MKEFTWSDQIGSRGRKPWLILRRGDRLMAFTGSDIPGVCAVANSQYTRQGKWSSTEYRLALADDVHLLPGRAGWEEGTFREGVNAFSWPEAANRLGVSIPSVQAFLRDWRPKAAEWYDSVEERIAAIDDTAPDGAETIALSFGRPTRRQRAEGYWDWPIRVLDADGAELASFAPEEYATEGVTRGCVTVTQFTHSKGPGGGYVSIRFAAPAGATAVHGGDE